MSVSRPGGRPIGGNTAGAIPAATSSAVVVRPYHVDAILGRIAATLITVSDARVAIPALRPKVSAAVEHVSRHFGEKLRAEDVAQAVHVSAKQLGQEFRDSLGITAKEFITRVRINAACRLVIGADHKLEHIAALTGFDDASHLSRVFARQRGIRPGEYRRRLEAKQVTTRWPLVVVVA